MGNALPTREERRAVVAARWKLRKAFMRALDQQGHGWSSLAAVEREIRHNVKKDYLAHSHDDVACISYARSESHKFLPKRRVKTTLGRYLRRQFAKETEFIGDEVLEDFCSRVMSYLLPADRFFKVLSGYEIQEAYRHEIGGHSCMTGSDSNKVEIYAINPKTVSLLVYNDGQMTARCLVWKTDQGVTVADRIYPNSGRHVAMFHEYFKSKGWARRASNSAPFDDYGGIEGHANLSVTLDIPSDPIYPYMDTFRYFRESSDVSWSRNTIRLHVTSDDRRYSTLDSTSGDGPGGGETYRCSSCECRLSDDDVYYDESGETYCSDCYYEIYSRCERCDCECSNDDTVTVSHGRYGDQTWCSRCARRYADECAICSNTFPNDDLETVEGDNLCSDCVHEHASCCDDCGDVFLNDNLIEVGRERICESCRNEREENDESDEQEASDVESVA